ncbi:MAG: hypothetical protein Q4P78_03910 [Rothia sp. (in: high G+C Gram-positive bacteria)]|uniref:hypothetical protein n=1 Tax=Rothia sp. (in: high G+C Gram-positive bacteria) TaxID=1885016 RepID=UPI0026E04642|nr:hypothetical protein [Rothia sp. (in: high G+C Gram-positive bacteria)]MDO5750335.1 hypothetical protein [Rothia sp. (in: high G+C Gram-positive bacteria)]
MSTHRSSQKVLSSRDSYTEYLRDYAQNERARGMRSEGISCLWFLMPFIMVSLFAGMIYHFGSENSDSSPTSKPTAVTFRYEYVRICVSLTQPPTPSPIPTHYSPDMQEFLALQQEYKIKYFSQKPIARVKDQLCEEVGDAADAWKRSVSHDMPAYSWDYIELDDNEDPDSVRIPAIGEAYAPRNNQYLHGISNRGGTFYVYVPEEGGTFKSCAYGAQQYLTLGYTSKILTAYPGGKEAYDKTHQR